MRYGVVDWQFVLEMRLDFGAKEKVVCGTCVELLIVFGGR
jgi:hypothetical protein